MQKFNRRDTENSELTFVTFLHNLCVSVVRNPTVKQNEDSAGHILING
jgi:hypothetical protein